MLKWVVWLSLATVMSSPNPSDTDFLPFCDNEYPGLTTQDLSSHQQPYLFDGKSACAGSQARQQPGCRQENNFTRFCEASLPYEWRHTYSNRSEYWKMNLVGSLETCTEDLIQSFIDELLKLEKWQILQLTPCDIFKQLKGRTLWLLGDSMMLDMMKALECFLRPFWKGSDWEQARTERQFEEGPVMPTCLPLQSDTRLCFLRLNTGDRLLHEGLPFLLREGDQKDLAILNFGLHGWWMEDIKIVASFLEIYRTALPTVFWKDMSPHHRPHVYQAATRQEKIDCKPILDADQQAQDQPFATAVWFNNLTIPVLQQSSIRVIQDEKTLRPFWRHHRQGECLHFCQPSAPQVWISSLHSALTEAEAFLPE